MIERHAAGGLIFDTDKVLTISWIDQAYVAFPKGGVEAGETSEEAAVREVFEETGYHAKVISLLGSWTYDFTKGDKKYRKTVDYYLMERVNDAPPTPHREPGENFENLWLDLEEARDSLTYDDSKGALDAARALLGDRPVYAGLLANETRYFKNHYQHEFVTKPASESQAIIEYVETILKSERDVVLSARPVEAARFQTGETVWTYVFYQDGLVVNVLYSLEEDGKRAVGFKLADAMPVPRELAGKFRFARQRSKLAGTIRGSYFVIKGDYNPYS